LRIEVYDEHAVVAQREGRGEIDGSGGLAHTALLIRHGDDRTGPFVGQWEAEQVTEVN
jgi:hypothetical protein